VEMLGGVKYLKRDSAGLHIMHKGQLCTLEVDQIVVCAGQKEEDHLSAELKDGGLKYHIIGVAAKANELDARAAILEGTLLAQGI
jgi:2,4-dienoyl-CoA reductase (NADPH2)